MPGRPRHPARKWRPQLNPELGPFLWAKKNPPVRVGLSTDAPIWDVTVFTKNRERLLEGDVEQLGVSPKQKERARQTFMKSAQYAGFIDASSGRFVKPGIAAKEEGPQHNIDDGKKNRNNGGDGNEPPDLHPFVQGLLKELPKAGEVWPEAQRKLWLDTAASIFKMIYKNAEMDG